ncbi:MAG: calcium/sodium antiporter [Parvibaculum sp.]|uniref:calcium/sodium antiporter n=1 Tax=Parvibaculum sp. TaxID=2024848 RepID=UPI0025EBB190|nr:calcium/sodium antiporter [Parvibaculum sp.]MCE9649446.1 calcium/sodium antiporter [Parvibaculum sp.]
MTYLSLAGGLLLLLLCGDLLVRGAAGLAARAGISPLVIALTVVALGTSMPELMISVDAALRGSPDIALGNVVGSNIANILLVLGLPALAYPIACRSQALGVNTGFMLAVSGLLIALCFLGPLTRGEGLLLIALLAAYLAWSVRAARGYRLDARERAATTEALVKDVKETGRLIEHAVEEIVEKDVKPATMSRLVIGVFILVGCIGLPIGARLVVEGGTGLARAFDIPEAAIALSLIAIGTSLPELSTSLMAAWRRQHELAIGNVVGSNIINILAILGVSSLIAPLPVAANFLHLDLWVMLLAALAIVPTVAARGSITRTKGAIFVLSYVIYLFAIFQPEHVT